MKLKKLAATATSVGVVAVLVGGVLCMVYTAYGEGLGALCSLGSMLFVMALPARFVELDRRLQKIEAKLEELSDGIKEKAPHL